MRTRTYSQYCGLACALELIGERWALLIVRDLLLGPKRFTDLRRGLPRIPTNILSARLKELEASGVVQRRLLPRPQGSVVYELTDYGRELDDVVLRLDLWGARSLGHPQPRPQLLAKGGQPRVRQPHRVAGRRALTAEERGPVVVEVAEGRRHLQ